MYNIAHRKIFGGPRVYIWGSRYFGFVSQQRLGPELQRTYQSTHITLFLGTSERRLYFRFTSKMQRLLVLRFFTGTTKINRVTYFFVSPPPLSLSALPQGL